MDTSSWIKYKKVIGGLLGIVLAVAISRATPPAPLNLNSMIFLGTFACAVIWWLVELIPDYATCLLMCTSWVILKVVPFTTAFSAFGGETFWLLVGALGIGLGVAESGLLDRVALTIMSRFPPNFKGMTTAIYVAGNVINPLIPSVTAKVSIVAPFSKAIGDKLGFQNESEGMGGLFAAMFMSTGVLYPLFLSASLFNYILVGLMPKDVAQNITWLSWLSATWVWGLVVMILGYVAVQMLYKPQETHAMEPGFITSELARLGPMSSKEKIVGLILAVALGMWITERLHGISAAQVALVALILMLAFNIFDRVAFRSKIAWDSICFIGGILNLAALFPVLKVDKWIGISIGPYMQPLMSNIYLFIVALCLLLFVLRFVLVSQAASLTMFIVLLAPLATAMNMNPLIPAFIVLTAVNLWNVVYQNTTFLAAFYAGGGMVKHSQTIKMSVSYAIINIVALLASIPLWKLLGMLP